MSGRLDLPTTANDSSGITSYRKRGKSEKLSHVAKKKPESRNRARTACDNCKEKRIKCSGMPGPCVGCQQQSKFCEFHPRSDTRRKDITNSTDSQDRRKFILQGLLLALRLNSDKEIQELLHVFRSPVASVTEMAKSLQTQLQIVHENGEASRPHITEDDILSLALSSIISHGKNLSPTSGDDSSQKEPTLLLSANQRTELPSFHHAYHSPTALSEHSMTHLQHPWKYGQFASVTTEISGFYQYEQSIFGNSEVLGSTSSTESSMIPDTDMEEVDIYNVPQRANMVGHDAAAKESHYAAFDFPLSHPVSDFSKLCTQFRDAGRQLLAHGINFEDLGCLGRMDCGLLFRDRNPYDVMNIPNWACEVARRLPPLCPGTRIALALSIARIMPFLLMPSQFTWELLPPVLRPTECQLRTPHDITVNFVPIPILRTYLTQRPVDWLKHASHHDLRLKWPGSWGNTGGASLTEVGNWRQTCQTWRPQARKDLSDTVFSAQTTLKAVDVDPISNRRYVTEDFEKHCWETKNWHIGQGIVAIWPEIGEHL